MMEIEEEHSTKFRRSQLQIAKKAVGTAELLIHLNGCTSGPQCCDGHHTVFKYFPFSWIMHIFALPYAMVEPPGSILKSAGYQKNLSRRPVV